jgi:toxin-antitoxin system PIN domain toxin
MVALLDVSALIGLFDPSHEAHGRLRDWFLKHAREGWATCPITENGFARIVSQPSYPHRMPLDVAWEALASASRSKYHQFWACDYSMVQGHRVKRDQVVGPSQITDTYLLGLAVAKSGTFVTLDRRINIASVSGATADNLTII